MMCSQLVSRSGYVPNALAKADAYAVQDVAQQTAAVSEITKVANHQVAQVGAHAVGTMAQLVQGSNDVSRQLTDSGHRSSLFDDCRDKVLQVTGTNLITLSNTAQQEILRKASSYMR